MYATSPDRFSFMININKKRIEENPNNPENKDIEKLIEFYEEAKERDAIPCEKTSLEKDLRSSEYIVSKCKKSDVYSQNLYAALCNNEFIKENENWSCSWRHAGGVISNLREEGDYINWYCSGITGDMLTEEEMGGKEFKRKDTTGYVSEGIITLEVSQDLSTLGWRVK